MTEKPAEKDRYKPRHAFYLPDAQLLVRALQAIAWPLNYHVCLGGSVLNHGYSNKDIDIYVLPIYPRDDADFEHDPQELLDMFRSLVLGTQQEDYNVLPPSLEGTDVKTTCFAEARQFSYEGGHVDVFVVKP